VSEGRGRKRKEEKGRGREEKKGFLSSLSQMEKLDVLLEMKEE
jgi:hypothetical protein